MRILSHVSFETPCILEYFKLVSSFIIFLCISIEEKKYIPITKVLMLLAFLINIKKFATDEKQNIDVKYCILDLFA